MNEQDKVNALIWYQKQNIFHKLTCGNSSLHDLLTPEVLVTNDEISVNLLCKTCGWRQLEKNIPKIVFQLWNENGKQDYYLDE